MLTAGDHEGRIILSGEGVGQSAIPLRLHIASIRFPDRPALHLGGWDYTDQPRVYEVNPENRAAFLGMLRDHFVDSPWAQSSVLPTGNFDAEGRMTTPPDTPPFASGTIAGPRPGCFFVFANLGPTFAGLPMGTPAFKRAVGTWISWWVKTLRAQGVAPEQLGLLIVDEPRERQHDRVIIEYAGAIHAAEPKVEIWEDPIWEDPAQATPGMFGSCDVLCPNLPMWIAGGAKFARCSWISTAQAGGSGSIRAAGRAGCSTPMAITASRHGHAGSSAQRAKGSGRSATATEPRAGMNTSPRAALTRPSSLMRRRSPAASTWRRFAKVSKTSSTFGCSATGSASWNRGA